MGPGRILGDHRPRAAGLLLATLVLPVTLLGMIFPWLLARHATATGTGRLYAVNTAGAVIGALTAGFILLPWNRFDSHQLVRRTHRAGRGGAP